MALRSSSQSSYLVLRYRRLLFEGVRSLVIVPHVSLCAEKVQHLRQLLGPLTLRVEAFHAGASEPQEYCRRPRFLYLKEMEKDDIVVDAGLVLDLLVPEVATGDVPNEVSKALVKCEVPEASLPPSAQDESGSWANEWWESLHCRMAVVGEDFPVGLVCVDELHFVGDPQRGHLLEMVLAKLLFLNESLKRRIQLIGMSATLPNARQIADWLNAELFVTDERPSPLDIFVKVGPEVFSWDKASGLQLARKLHGGSLSLLPVGDAATCAAARAVRAAASACAAATAGLLPATLEHTADSSGGHAFIAASALRFLREQPDADSSVLSSPGREDPSRHSKTAATTVGLRAGWQADAEHLGALTWEILREGRKVIIFCPTQEWTARTASFLAKALPFYRRAEAWADLIKQRTAALLERRRLRHPAAVQPFLQNQQNASDAVQEQKNRLQQEQKQAYLEALEELLAMPVTLLAQLLVQSPHLYVEPQNLKGREELQWHLKQISLLPPTTMLAAVCEGVAYHHAGLSGEERELLEMGYRKGYLNVLCATSTLALGVNLPAARVIIRAPHFGRDELLSPGRFHQMAGRAGRKGLEHKGDAYLICSPTTLPHVRKLLDAVASADMSDSASCTPKCCVNAVTSNLRGQHLCRFFLEAVHVLLPLVRRWRETPKSLASCAFVDVAAILLRCTLRGHQEPHTLLVREAAEAARYLHTYYLIEAEPSGPLPICRTDESAGIKSCSGSYGISEANPQISATTLGRPHWDIASEKSVSVVAAADEKRRHPLRSLAFPSACLSAACRLLLQQYPCLRSPVVLARMLQGCEIKEKAREGLVSDSSGSAQQLVINAAATPSGNLPVLPTGFAMKVGAVGRSNLTPTCGESDAFASSVRLHFRGLEALATHLDGEHNLRNNSKVTDLGEMAATWRDIGGQIATTEVGGAAVEAGVAPWEAAELFADIFKASVLGLCACTELHLIFIAAVAVGGETQPHWQSYLSVYDRLDSSCRAALSEICFVLAGKLKLACSPTGALASALVDPSRKDNFPGGSGEEHGDSAALQHLLQLEGMTPRRAAALRAAQIYSCAQIVNSSLYDIFKALEAAEPAVLAPAQPEAQDVWKSKLRRQRARLLAVSVKLKDAAQKEQAVRLQALEDEAAEHWSLVGKVADKSGDEQDLGPQERLQV
ncbi:DNA polymerase theta, putative [Eimeria tenella]|uniref:DNA polymerase theta, putative n=1 Tax=Eimeria tenella TaxID=5802 RepID=U6KVU0_EIMTE|nr:DNA polymerase theta, putative [Eimeria tenella]CDJ42257.1 DNA polymerase theta, putative [Eimeria tenella]|eukprot:XP_013233007.1 DNA polymerase theta, putative [Eimeria tenella]